MISQEALPEGLVARCLDVLRKLSSGERDLIRLVVEVVQELRDLIRGDEPPEVRPFSLSCRRLSSHISYVARESSGRRNSVW